MHWVIEDRTKAECVIYWPESVCSGSRLRSEIDPNNLASQVLTMGVRDILHNRRIESAAGLARAAREASVRKKHPRPEGAGPGTGKGRYGQFPAKVRGNFGSWETTGSSVFAFVRQAAVAACFPSECPNMFPASLAMFAFGTIHCLPVMRIMPVHPSETLPQPALVSLLSLSFHLADGLICFVIFCLFGFVVCFALFGLPWSLTHSFRVHSSPAVLALGAAQLASPVSPVSLDAKGFAWLWCLSCFFVWFVWVCFVWFVGLFACFRFLFFCLFLVSLCIFACLSSFTDW